MRIQVSMTDCGSEASDPWRLLDDIGFATAAVLLHLAALP